MTWKDTVQEYLGREQEYQTDERTETVFNRGGNSMTNTDRRVIEQRSQNGTDSIDVQQLLGETVYEHCKVCRRSLPDDGERSELFHITATETNKVNDTGVNIKGFCEHCAPSHAIDVDVMVKSGGSTPRDAYIYYEIDTVFMHESEL